MSTNYAALIEHEVDDFDTWKRAFRDHEDARKKASITETHVNRGRQDPNRVIVYLEYTSPEKAKAFFDSPDLRETMKAAGVTSAPEITFMEPVQGDAEMGRELPGMLVRHQVADYEEWREVYDSLRGLREEVGIVGEAVNRAGDEGNDIIVYHQAEDFETLEQFLNSDELENAMREAGVVEEPEVVFLRGGVA